MSNRVPKGPTADILSHHVSSLELILVSANIKPAWQHWTYDIDI